LLDSTKDSKIGPFGFTTYRSAKDRELMLGLDLQGGMSVTMEVGLDGLIRSLANYTKDPVFNKALDAAVKKKATSGADLITLFTTEFKNASAGAKLAPYFVTRSNEKIKYDASDDAVATYLRDQAKSAFDNTTRILTTRIDRFGVASPNINPDPQKGIINIELAGINDPERVRHYLQSTANLQFFEVYNVNDVGEGIVAAEKSLSDYLKGTSTSASDTAKQVVDTTNAATAAATSQADTNAISGFEGAKNTTTKTAAATGKVDSVALMRKEFPIRSLMQPAQPHRDEASGKVQYPAAIGYVSTNDTGLLSQYLNYDFVKNKFPANLKFAYGKPENGTGDNTKNVAVLYAVKTLPNGMAELEGEHVSDARPDYDERGRPAIKMEMDATGTRIWSKMTTANVGKPIAIVLDNVVYSAPFVNGPIPNGSSQITGSFSTTEASDLSDILKSGKLPAPAKIVAEQQVGPTLGQDAVNGGSMSFIISFVVIFILMLVYYNTAGWVANFALILNLLFTIGILGALGFTLTAPGIAGLVLTIGMAVDTNVIIFERIKEELTKGKSYILAVQDGYKRSYAPVIDAHVTTFLTAAILFIFGLGSCTWLRDNANAWYSTFFILRYSYLPFDNRFLYQQAKAL
jgi:SecD/SecF fusion protein